MDLLHPGVDDRHVVRVLGRALVVGAVGRDAVVVAARSQLRVRNEELLVVELLLVRRRVIAAAAGWAAAVAAAARRRQVRMVVVQ